MNEEGGLNPDAGDGRKTVASHRVPKEYRHPARTGGLVALVQVNDAGTPASDGGPGVIPPSA